jgi:hypothetical protein
MRLTSQVSNPGPSWPSCMISISIIFYHRYTEIWKKRDPLKASFTTKLHEYCRHCLIPKDQKNITTLEWNTRQLFLRLPHSTWHLVLWSNRKHLDKNVSTFITFCHPHVIKELYINVQQDRLLKYRLLKLMKGFADHLLYPHSSMIY